MENDDFDIRKVILHFADENRPSSDVQEREQITLNLVDDFGEHYCLDVIVTWKDLYLVSYLIRIDIDWHNYSYIGEVIINNTQHDLNGMELRKRQEYN